MQFSSHIHYNCTYIVQSLVALYVRIQSLAFHNKQRNSKYKYQFVNGRLFYYLHFNQGNTLNAPYVSRLFLPQEVYKSIHKSVSLVDVDFCCLLVIHGSVTRMTEDKKYLYFALRISMVSLSLYFFNLGIRKMEICYCWNIVIVLCLQF